MNKAERRLNFKTIPFILFFIIRIVPLSGQDVLADSLLSERLQEIQKLVHQDRANAMHWWYGWLAGYSAATIGQGIVYISSDSKTTKQDMALGAATTFLGAIGQLLAPLVPPKSSIQSSQIYENDPEKQLVNQEEILKEIARREKAGRSWKMHAVTGVVNIGSGLITWLGFKRTIGDGLVNFALNTVITEAQIWTQPTRAVKDYQKYCMKYGLGSVPVALKPDNEWIVRAYPGGIAIEFNF
jgi:hypothetical protein